MPQLETIGVLFNRKKSRKCRAIFAGSTQLHALDLLSHGTAKSFFELILRMYVFGVLNVRLETTSNAATGSVLIISVEAYRNCAAYLR